jgi:hypothetical protein
MVKQHVTAVTYGTMLGSGWFYDITTMTYFIVEKDQLIVVEQMGGFEVWFARIGEHGKKRRYVY